MTHRVESIITAAKTTVTGLTTTGARVHRGRHYPLPSDESNWLLVYQGPERILQELSQGKVDCELEVMFEAVVKSPTAQLDTTLNMIREQVTIALMADFTLGLAYVHQIREGDTDQPDFSGEGEQPVGRMRMHWSVQYRRSRTNPGA